jgi:PIN domain nuclease of toxin-antitoxin system
VSLLLDTHVLLFWLEGHDLDAEVVGRISDPGTLVVVSAASVWETAIKQALGKLDAPEPLGEAALAEGFEPLSVTFNHAERAGGLPPHHRDPFDRMLIAQAQLEDLTIVTGDPAFGPYDVETLHC